MGWSSFVFRAVLSGAAVVVVPAAWAATPASDSNDAVPASTFRMSNALDTTDASFRYETAGVSSSAEDAAVDERASLSGGEGAMGATAPGGRRRSYGRSRYEDRMHNSDGSTKIAFVGGAGLNLPVANTGKFYTPSYTVTAGAGYNFNKMFGVLAEFHYDHMGVTGGAINAEYNTLINTYGATADDLAGFDANAHILALTVNPVVTYSPENGRLGAYVTAGGGYYRKTTNFTLPEYGQYCDYFCYTYATNVNVDSATANAVGVNGGVGLTYKISSFSSERLFVEARYHWISINSSNNQDIFPYNRRNTEYIPITAGIRF